jgi:hypothetical protein
LNALAWEFTAIGLIGIVWILVDVLRGTEPSTIAFWMLLPLPVLGVLLNVALGVLVVWRMLRKTCGQSREDRGS